MSSRIHSTLSTRGRHVVAWSTVCICCVGCAGTPEAKSPDPSTNTIGRSSTPTLPKQLAMSEFAEIDVRARTHAWPGDAEVTKHVTPIRLVVENHSATGVRLLYEDFVIITDTGDQFAALPPHAVDGEVSKRVLVENYRPPHALFHHNDFYLAPPYVKIYPHLSLYPNHLPHDQTYYPEHFSYWDDMPLPTPEMLDRALPEGVLESGGQVDGFVYFEHVSGEGPFTLVVDLTTPGGAPIGNARIDL